MGKDIKNCPFCGGKANLFSKHKIYDDNSDSDNEYAPNGYSIRCKCSVCGARGKEFISLEYPEDVNWDNTACQDAVNAWNTRNEKKSNHNLDTYDVIFKTALAYAQVTYEYELKNDMISIGEFAPPSIYLENRFLKLLTNACLEYGSSPKQIQQIISCVESIENIE